MDRSKKNSLFHVLLHKLGITAQKEALLSPFGVESVTELEEKDLDTLITQLNGMATAPPVKPTAKVEVSKTVRRLRSNIILVAEEYFDIKIASSESWAKFNALMLNPRIAGKPMTEMDEKELKTVHKKLQKLARDMASRRRFDKFQATHN